MSQAGRVGGICHDWEAFPSFRITFFEQSLHLVQLVWLVVVAPIRVDVIQDIGDVDIGKGRHARHFFRIDFPIHHDAVFDAVLEQTGQFFTIFSQKIRSCYWRYEGAQTLARVHVAIGTVGFIETLALAVEVGLALEEENGEQQKNAAWYVFFEKTHQQVIKT